MKKDYFTGPVTLREISGVTKPNEHDMYHVIFKKSARTKIHFHTGAQMLIVTKGNGSLVIIKKLVVGFQNSRYRKLKQLIWLLVMWFTSRPKYCIHMDLPEKIQFFHIWLWIFTQRIESLWRYGMNQISDQMLHLKYLEMFMKFFLRMLSR